MDHVDDVLAQAAQEIVPRLLPNGYVACGDSPGTLDEVIAFFERTGKVAVSNAFNAKRLFGTPAVCQCFDAWHDYCHVLTRGSFDIPGEKLVNTAQQAHLLQWWRTSKVPVTEASYRRAAAVLALNNVGRLEHWQEHDAPPLNFRDFANGYLVGAGMVHKHAPCPRALPDLRNEWTSYVEGPSWAR